MHIQRLFGILYLLLERRQVTAPELAQHFEVSTRTIYRDIDTLSSAGIPIYAAQGKHGGIALHDGYKLNQAMFNEDERNQVLLALQSMMPMKEQNQPLLLDKVRGLFQTREPDWIKVDVSRWGCQTQDQHHFDCIRQAILNQTQIKLSYINGYGTIKTHNISPYQIVYKANTWYLQGMDQASQEIRTYRLSRMLEVSSTKLPNLSQAEPISSLETVDLDQMNLVTVRVNCKASMGYRLYDEFPADAITKQADGSYELEVELPNDAWLIGYLLSFGSAIKVHAPECVKEALQTQASAILHRYR